MKKIVCTLFLSLMILALFLGNHVYPNEKKLRPIEESYYELDYSSVEQALDEFEDHFGKEVKLPIKMPSVPFTHRFGRFNDLEGDVDDSLEIEYINEKNGEVHYKIDIRPRENKLELKNSYIKKVYKLQNQTEALYSTNFLKGSNLFVFEKDGWQYLLGVDKRMGDEVTAQVLVSIANSIK